MIRVDCVMHDDDTVAMMMLLIFGRGGVFCK